MASCHFTLAVQDIKFYSPIIVLPTDDCFFMYSVKEVFYTLQGEGANTGRPAVFCRFSGCNLWSGLEKHRSKAMCTFCDTDFRGTDGLGGGQFATAEALAHHARSFWPAGSSISPFIVCTGGEPLLQLDQPLIDALHASQFEIAVETNGTREVPAGIDWLTVSPKGNAKVVVTECDELKLVYPQHNAMPEKFTQIKARYYFLTPVADPRIHDDPRLYRSKATQETIRYCLEHQQWRLNLQAHKVVDIA